MERNAAKVPKACEPCRRRKIRCDGKQPCVSCQHQPAACTYRVKARTRWSSQHPKPAAQPDRALDPPSGTPEGRAREESDSAPDTGPEEHGNVSGAAAHDNIGAAHAEGITATHGTGSIECSQLYYGASSTFAFLQHVYRDAVSNGAPERPGIGEVAEGGAGLDRFVQRSIFFGTPSRVDATAFHPPSTPLHAASFAQATTFMAHFRTASRHLTPFFTDPELDDMLLVLYHDASHAPAMPQRNGMTFAVLAIGALCTPHTDAAEALYIQAKQVLAIYDEAVTVPVIQLSILLAVYQLNMGRPNSAYLHLGVACRKAFALGLHRDAAGAHARAGDLQKRRATMWSLYCHEGWQALALGREAGMKMGDISCLFPDTQPVLANLCRLVHIVEQVYYHAVILTFRPFLIARSALRSSGRHQEEEMWLRQACRLATDAAHDSLVFFRGKYRSSEECKSFRYNAFFIESSCAVLMHNILWHPSKHAYNLDYVQIALQCLGAMVDDEPVTNARKSIRQILQAVEQSIAKIPSNSWVESMPTGHSAPLSEALNQQHHEQSQSGMQYAPSQRQSSNGAEELIHFSDRYRQLPSVQGDGQANALALGSDPSMVALDPLTDLDLDIFATDLWNFFPTNTWTPSDQPNQIHGHGG
ncbi:hypothetical protein LTR36_002502 [Oleoguttula mirabilis]|uniref:Zn(2)-C6 fungal-type domain-containing protein n=1 Tax=Oleoguttula mirabilis TaxID=1507867 RepID=A0AAV9JKV2_9PEZI|nr:hypothetical protein LTR36_002502 [Oleoguttula mirabilis]